MKVRKFKKGDRVQYLGNDQYLSATINQEKAKNTPAIVVTGGGDFVIVAFKNNVDSAQDTAGIPYRCEIRIRKDFLKKIKERREQDYADE